MATHTLASFAAHLYAVNAVLENQTHHGLRDAGEIVKREAQRVLGTYDYNWPQLAPSTIARKRSQANTPGIETSEMHDSIGVHLERTNVEIGTDNQKAVWFELGTNRGQPPRSFLAGALIHKKDEVVDAIAARIGLAFANVRRL
jgi:hypothetical protein